MVGGGLRNVTTCDKDGEGVKKSWNSYDVIYSWLFLLIFLSPDAKSGNNPFSHFDLGKYGDALQKKSVSFELLGSRRSSFGGRHVLIGW